MGLLDDYFGDDEDKDYLLGQIHRVPSDAFRIFLSKSLEALSKDAKSSEKQKVYQELLRKKQEGSYDWSIRIVCRDLYPDLSTFRTSEELFYLHVLIEGNIVNTDRVPNVWGFLDENDPEFIED